MIDILAAFSFLWITFALCGRLIRYSTYLLYNVRRQAPKMPSLLPRLELQRQIEVLRHVPEMSIQGSRPVRRENKTVEIRG